MSFFLFPLFLQCTGCYQVFYCATKCQRKHWKEHKDECSVITQQIHQVANRLRLDHKGGVTLVSCLNKMSRDVGLTSTTLPFALDLLQLPKNELSREDFKFNQLKTLTMSDNFLPTFMFTSFSLPDDFDKSVTFVHFERLLSTAARDVLLLYVLINRDEAPQVASDIIPTIWFSLRLSTEVADYLNDTLKELSSMAFKVFRNKVGGKLHLQKSNFNRLKEVWKFWSDVDCRIGSDGCLSLEKKRKNELRKLLKGVEEYREFLPELHIPSVDQWFGNGNFMQQGCDENCQNLSHYNPLLTEHPRFGGSATTQSAKLNLQEGRFAVRTDWLPFKVFDYGVMKKSFTEMPISAVELVRQFITKMIPRLEALFDDEHIKIDVKLLNDKVPNIVTEDKFDRIMLPPQVTDGIGISSLLDDYAGRVNKLNPFTTVIMESTKWFPLTNVQKGVEAIQVTADVCFSRCQYTNYLKQSHALDFHSKTTEFVSFLRAEYLAYQQSKNPASNQSLPKLTEIFGRSGKWCLKDFRKEKNRIVPFIFRVHPRSMNNLSGHSRFLEWRLFNEN